MLPPVMFCRRRMFAMMHLHNFCQISIEEVRLVMTRLSVKVPLSTYSEGRRLKIRESRQLELRTPCEKFLATPLACDKLHASR